MQAAVASPAAMASVASTDASTFPTGSITVCLVIPYESSMRQPIRSLAIYPQTPNTTFHSHNEVLNQAHRCHRSIRANRNSGCPVIGMPNTNDDGEVDNHSVR